MPESDLKQIQVAANKGTEMRKLVEVKIEDDDKSHPTLQAGSEKTLYYKDANVEENVRIRLEKRVNVPHEGLEMLNQKGNNSIR